MGNDDLDAGAPARGPGTIAHYINQSFVNAFRKFSNRDGAPDADADPRAFCVHQFREWEPLRGYKANRERILALYDYYRDLYLRGKRRFVLDVFLWAGLGRMAGGAVVGGLDDLSNGVSIFHLLSDDIDERTVDQVDALSAVAEGELREHPVVGLLEIGKLIFLDLAWQHEAFLDEPNIAIELAKQYDGDEDLRKSTHHPDLTFRKQEEGLAKASRNNSYAAAWRDVISTDPEKIAAGNRSLLENEQFNLIQPVYDDMLRQSNLVTSFSTPFTGNIHPYHKPFIESQKTGQILRANDRWAWITEPLGMLDKWAFSRVNMEMKPSTRERLVKTELSVSIAHGWPIDQPELELVT